MRDDVDGTADGVAAEQGALRPLEDFDALHVQQILVGADGPCEVYAVQVHADTRVEVEREVVLTDTADGGRQRRAVTGKWRAAIQVYVRCEVRNLLKSLDSAALQRRGRECGDRDGHILEVLGALLRGNNDFLQSFGGRRRGGNPARDIQSAGDSKCRTPSKSRTVHESVVHLAPLSARKNWACCSYASPAGSAPAAKTAQTTAQELSSDSARLQRECCIAILAPILTNYAHSFRAQCTRPVAGRGPRW